MEVHANMLGTAAFRQGDTSFELPAGKTSALLYYLACQQDWVGRDELLFLLWPDTQESNARNNLSKLLGRSVKEHAFATALEIEATRLRWRIASNVEAFRQAIAEGQLAEAVQLYRGALLEGFRPHGLPEFDAWLERERETLHRAWRGAVLSLVTELEAAERSAEAAEILERLCRADPFDEEALRHYLQQLQLSGRRQRALEAYSAFQRTLERELSAEPEQATSGLAERIRREEDTPRRTEAAGSSAAKTDTGAPEHNLPLQPTRFVGRKDEQALLAEQLREPDCRLVTLVGPGGIGKTRLALKVAAGQLGGFRHGVRFVPFVSVTAPELMVQAIADALGFPLVGMGEARGKLLEYLRDKELLLVLDNLEHLLTGVDLIATILETAPRITLLATSRERLNLHAERIFDLSGLTVPAKADETAASSDAVELFVQCAGNQRRGFALDEATRPAVTHICQLLAGHPLAIELAASWLRVLPLAEIVQEIEGGSDLLRASTRDLPARHRSIRAVFDHSWQLLSDAEQAALRKLAVFRGGFRRQAAEPVADADLSLLAKLVDKSFLNLAADGRYRRHPLTLQYSQARLAEHPAERSATEERHGRYFLDFVRQREGALRTIRRRETIAAIEAELANIRAAWGWAVAQRRTEEIRSTVMPLADFYEMRPEEGVELFAEAIRGLDDAIPDHQVALGYVLVSNHMNLWMTSRMDDLRRFTTRGLELLRSLAEDRGTIYGLFGLANAVWTGDVAQARSYAEEGLALARSRGGPKEISLLLWQMAIAAKTADDFPNAGTFFRASLAELRELGDVVNLAGFLAVYGAFLSETGAPTEAKAVLQESLQLQESLGSPLITITLDELAMAHYHLGEFEEARALLERSLALAQERAEIFGETTASIRLGKVATALGEQREAEQLLRRGLQLSRSIAGTLLELFALAAIAELRASQGRAKRAATLASLVLHHHNSEKRDKMDAERLLAALSERLAPEELEAAVEHGRELQLAEVVEEILGPSSG